MKINVKYKNKIISSLFTSGLLIYFLFKTNDLLSKIVISLFLIFGISFCATNILLAFNKNKIAKKISKVYTVVFMIYWYGFLIYWDYLCILNKEYMLFIFSFTMWFAGGYFIYKRFFKK